MVTLVSPTKITTKREPLGESVWKVSHRLGFVRFAREGWWVVTRRVYNNETWAFDYQDHPTRYRSKVEAVRALLDLTDNGHWGYYGESWEAHCKRIVH